MCNCQWCEEERAAGRNPEREGVPPKAERPTYFVTATYATPNGNMGRWSGRMASATGDILADAERLVRKYRRVAGKLTIHATALKESNNAE